MISSESSVTPSRPLRILVVDDEPSDREMLTIALTAAKSDLAIAEVEDGIQAMQYLRKQDRYASASKPDLIFLDLNLPGRDGRDVLRDIRGDRELKGVPVVILTTSNDERDIIGSYDSGANTYIVKPGNFRDFTGVVARLRDYWFATATLPRGP